MSPAEFPHLLPEEVLLWRRFLAEHGPEWDRFEYDVHVGEGATPPPGSPAHHVHMIAALSQKRVDVVGWLGGQPTLFEVTPRGGRAALGALTLYADLFSETFPGTPPPHLAAVVGFVDPDIARIFTARQIRVYVVTPLGVS